MQVRNTPPSQQGKVYQHMIDGLIAGRLYGTPEERTDKSGKPYAVAKVRATSNDGESMFVNVISFDAAPCAALLVLHDGESLALTGTITPRVWTDKQGNTRPSLDMVAHQVLTAYHVRHKRTTTQRTLAPQRRNSADLSDEFMEY